MAWGKKGRDGKAARFCGAAELSSTSLAPSHAFHSFAPIGRCSSRFGSFLPFPPLMFPQKWVVIVSLVSSLAVCFLFYVGLYYLGIKWWYYRLQFILYIMPPAIIISGGLPHPPRSRTVSGSNEDNV